MRVLSFVAALVIAPAAAVADGGPPWTQSIRFAEDHPQSIYAMTNYGLMISHDAGCTFEWVCEQAIGYGGEYEPELEVSRAGAIFATTQTGLRMSTDDGCSWSTATAARAPDDPARLPDGFPRGLSLGPDDTVWVTVAATDGTNEVFVSRDLAASFTALGLRSPDVLWGAIRAAPSDPQRAYVVAQHRPSGVELRRIDGTASIAVAAAGIALAPFPSLQLPAVDPEDRDVLYVVSEGANDPIGDVLFRSADGGETFERVFSTEGLIRDVVVEDDGAVIVTYLQLDGRRFVAGPPQRSVDGGRTFSPYETSPTLACLSISPSGALVGCGHNYEPYWAAVTRRDGDTWSKVWRFNELLGPLRCGGGTTVQVQCEPAWEWLQRNLISLTGPTCGPHAPDAGTSIPPQPSPPESCCGTGARPTSLAWAGVVMLGLSIRRRRRARGLLVRA